MNNSEVYNNIIDPLVMMTGKKKKTLMIELKGDHWMHYMFYMHTVLYVTSYGTRSSKCVFVVLCVSYSSL